MKSPLISLVALALVSVGSIGIVHAASDESTPLPTGTETTVQVENPLLVESIEAIDDMHITVKFNQDIIRESVRVRIAKQSDESNIRIESFDEGTDSMSMSVTLTDAVEASTAYKMTIISAISESGVIIKDGADGIKEFTTSQNLAKYAPVVLNAPSNPNAVMVDVSTATGTEESTTELTPTTAEEEITEMTPSETAEELPLTGADSTIFIIIAAILGWILVFRRRQA